MQNPDPPSPSNEAPRWNANKALRQTNSLPNPMGYEFFAKFTNPLPTNSSMQISDFDWYTYILETAVEGIWVVDQDGIICLVNQRFAQMLGYGVEELVGRALFDLVELEEIDRVRHLHTELSSEFSQDASRYFKFLRRDRQPLIASISVTPLFDRAQEYHGTLGRVYDITPRIQAEAALRRSEAKLRRSEQRYRLLAGYATDIISLHRARDGKPLYISSAVKQLLGYDQEQLMARSPLGLIHPEDRIRVELAYRVVQEQLVSNCVSYRVLHRNQTYIWIESTLRAIADNNLSEKIEQIVVVSRDVTTRREIEAELLSSAERLRLVIESTQDGLWDWDVNSGQVYVSLRFLEMFGFDRQVQTFDPWFWIDRCHPHDRIPTFRRLSEHIDQFTVNFESELRLKHANGDWVWVLLKAKVVERLKNGEAKRIVGTIADISDRKQVQANLQSQYQKELLLKRITSEIRQTIDSNRIFETASAELGQALRVSRCLIHSFSAKPEPSLRCVGEYLDHQVISLLSLELKVRDFSFCRLLLDSDQVVVSENIYQDPVFKSFSALGRAIQLKSILAVRTSYLGQPNGAIILHQCNRYRTWRPEEIQILESVAAQVGIAIAQAELLEQERHQKITLAAQNQALEIANQKAEAASLAKGQFLAMMSHEIRTPMNAIIGITELILRQSQDQAQIEQLQVVLNSGEVLLAILNDILDFSKIESDRLELNPSRVNLRECLESIFDLLASKAQEKNLSMIYSLDANVPRWINSDQVRLKQVLTNLLSNSLKFSDRGEIVVQVLAKPLGQDYELEFSVHDRGIGIDPTKMERLFQPFSQMDSSTTREYGGTGLGLAISKRLVELLGGNMWVVSGEAVAGDPPSGWLQAFMAQRQQAGSWYPVAAEKSGSSFYFTIATQDLTQDPNEEQDWDRPNSLQGKVIIAIAQDTCRHLLGTQLRQWGLSTRLTESSLELFALLQNGEQFNALILDLEDSEQVAAQVHQLSSYQSLPILIAQGIADLNLPEHCYGLRRPIKQSFLYQFLQQRINHNPPPLPATPKPKQAAAGFKNLRILLTEDNVVNQKVAMRMLQHLGFTADIAQDGVEAVEAFEQIPYDLILMDIQMPRMDGLEACRQIRQREATRATTTPTKIIAMTANAMTGDREMCLSAGMDEYVTKPVSLEKLNQMLCQFFPD
ncbi:MAG: PAS domain S-box protein [Pseudanabaenaceae cyanobacterium bins.68]|nr:PAS domain S-box protein [Pseudanabaenaceae cyanobacterium bins.68]